MLPWWAVLEVCNWKYIQGIRWPISVVNLVKLISKAVHRQENKNPNDPSKQEHFQTAEWESN